MSGGVFTGIVKMRDNSVDVDPSMISTVRGNVPKVASEVIYTRDLELSREESGHCRKIWRWMCVESESNDRHVHV